MSRLLPYDTFLKNDGSLIALEPDRFQALAEGQKLRLDSPLTVDLGLAYDLSRSEPDFFDDPIQDLNGLLDYSRFVRPRADGEVGLELADPGSLREVLTRRLAQRPAAASFKDLEELLKRSRRPLIQSARAALTQSRALLGHLGTCAQCGIPGCQAAYGWVERNLGLLVVETSGGTQCYVNVLAEA